MRFIIYIAPWVIVGANIVYLLIENDRLKARIKYLETRK